MRRTVNKLLDLTMDHLSGSTLTLAYLQVGNIYINSTFTLTLRATVAQIGDSVFALSRKDGHVTLAKMHTIENSEVDISVIKKAYLDTNNTTCRVRNGYIYSGDLGISVTRALGDANNILVRKPTIKTYEADPKTARILFASDCVLVSKDPTRKQVGVRI